MITFGTEAGTHGPRAAYAIHATGNWVEDFGAAQLVNGLATVTMPVVRAPRPLRN